MPIRPFITLSCDFVKAVDTGFITPFQTRHIKSRYWGMGVQDRLRIHGIIDREDYVNNPPKNLKIHPLEQRLHTLETIQDLLRQINHGNILSAMNLLKIDDPQAFNRITLLGCTAVYIAIDLGYAILDKPKPSFTPPPCTI